jgi:NitT/TauT family transport system permease protein
MRILGIVLPPLLVFIVIVAAAEIYLRWRAVPAYLVPKPSAILDVFRDPDQREQLTKGLRETTKATLIGFGGSAVAGVVIAVLLSSARVVQRAVYPYTIFFQTVPLVAIAPLLVIWLGYGLKAVAISAFIVSVFPVIANTLAGLLSTDPALRDLFRLYGASRVATLWKLRLPAALPNIFTGLRIAAGLAVIGTIVGEVFAGSYDNAGLGFVVVEAKGVGRTDLVFAAVLTASLLGLAMLSAINLLGWLALRRWHASEQS